MSKDMGCQPIPPSAAASNTVDPIPALVQQLCALTERWTTYEDIPGSQQNECRRIGNALNAAGGMLAMQDAYYEAKGRNRAASTIQAYWDGIGDWRW